MPASSRDAGSISYNRQGKTYDLQRQSLWLNKINFMLNLNESAAFSTPWLKNFQFQNINNQESWIRALHEQERPW
jgi:hypothetical protein